MRGPEERALRECIREILKEDDYAGLGLGDNNAGAPYGAHYADSDALYKTFIKPFADVFSVAAGKTKEASQKAQTLLKVSFETIATTLIPVLRDDYAEIFAHEKEEIDKIRSEYGSVYQATWDAFNEMDILIPAFMYRPDLFITAKFIKKAPKAAAKLLSVLSGGALDKTLGKLLKPDAPNQGTGIGSSGGGGGPGMGGGDGFGYSMESLVLSTELVLEDKPKKQQGESVADKLIKLVNDKRVKEMISNGEQTQRASRVGQNLVRNTLKDVFERAQSVLSAKNLNDIQRITGKQAKGAEELNRLPQEQRQQAEAALVKTLKKSMKEFYVKQLEAHVKSVVDAGLSQDHPFVKDYLGVIQKLRQL